MNRSLCLGSIFAMIAIVACTASKGQSDPVVDDEQPSDVPPADPVKPSDTTPQDNQPVVEPDAGQDSSVVTDAGRPAATNQATCIAYCEADFPAGHVKGQAIDTCWKASCDPSCTHMPDRLPGGQVTGPTAASTNRCVQQVLTPSPSCSDCNSTFCCAEWDGCFGDTECVALNQCAIKCFTDFAQ